MSLEMVGAIIELLACAFFVGYFVVKGKTDKIKSAIIAISMMSIVCVIISINGILNFKSGKDIIGIIFWIIATIILIICVKKFVEELKIKSMKNKE